MCMNGFVGNIQDNSLENKIRLEAVIKLMLCGMSESNRDGTGVIFSTQSNKILLHKTAKPGAEVASKFEIDPSLDYKHFVLHTRMATHGAATDENAHPHETSFGYLIHNGWCPSLYQKHKDMMKTGCDTEALAFIYNNNLQVFNNSLNGYEHFALIHLDHNGKDIMIMNKNKSLYHARSTVLSADIVLTSSSVLANVGKLLGETLDITSIPDNYAMALDGSNLIKSEFKFTDNGYEMYSWEGNDSNWHKWKQAQGYGGYRNLEPVSYRGRQDDMPKHVKKMTRKERKRWIKDNKARREEYVQFWQSQAEANDERISEHLRERDWDADGFQVLDYLGNAIDED